MSEIGGNWELRGAEEIDQANQLIAQNEKTQWDIITENEWLGVEDGQEAPAHILEHQAEVEHQRKQEHIQRITNLIDKEEYAHALFWLFHEWDITEEQYARFQEMEEWEVVYEIKKILDLLNTPAEEVEEPEKENI